MTPQQVINQLNTMLPINLRQKYKLDNKQKLAMFLAQMHHESMGFTVTRENLNYSAEGLIKIFSKYFNVNAAKKYFKNLHDLDKKTDAELLNMFVQTYARKPEKIANYVYANRMGNGDEASGDGWKYRGTGYPQLTGLENCSLATIKLDIDLINNPELATKPEIAMLTALWFWDNYNLNDSVNDIITVSDNIVKAQVRGVDDMIEVTKKINGGKNGIKERQALYIEYLKLAA